MNGATLMASEDGLDPLEWSEWRGGIDKNMISMIRRMGVMEGKMDDLPEKIEKRIEKLINGPKGNPGNSSVITFKWVVERFLLPVTLLVIAAVIALVFGG